MNITVRKGYKEDIPAVLGLVKELAAYEKAPNDVMVTVEDMERDGFGDDPIFSFFVAEAGEKVVGMALYYIKYSTWKGRCVFLEDIIVTENFRRYKIGKQLFEAVVLAAMKMKARRLEWQVLDWNTPAIKFYEKYDAQFLKEWLSCRLTEEQIEKIASQVSVNKG
ncbi:MAG TPA: GNAT family N-acetyltransferase [Bacteroidia bacterium]|jgi:GNAT superfamily N-acetyltransferase